ncbi:NUDIX hydrolase [Radiobacillus deserti]|uniref:NUDIX hydrolase n=1 Tax=Radiobacillus deserti TaxID=2594883 RepID=A0A516KI70_9BACI|nr:NUDIX hydrolase [Radiobacillus deserti]QDP41093.1 NUDIX hydrolase [Radiobacillus deserti]
MEYVKELRRKVGHQPLILPGAVVAIVNSDNRVLLQHRTDGGWGLPGGLMELGESLEDTARREVKEETNLQVGQLTLLQVFSGPEFYFKIPNGDELYSVTALYWTKDFYGDILVNEHESLDVRFFEMNNLPETLKEEYRTYLAPLLESL